MNGALLLSPTAIEREPGQAGAVIFDCDGLLLATEECWASAEAALFAEHDHPYGPEEKELLLGAGPGAAGSALAHAFALPGQDGILYARLLELATAEVVAGARPMPGAERLLHRLSGSLPLGVASNSPRGLVVTALDSTGLLRHFDAVVGSDDADAEKPAPDPYLLACSRLGAVPEVSVALEDSRTGVAAAKAAGMHVVGVPSEPESSLEADLVARSLSDEAVYRFIQDNVRNPVSPGDQGHKIC